MNKIIAFFILLTVFLAGCASVPIRDNLPTYSINGVTYLPLVTLCERKGIDWKYDTFSKAVVLTKAEHRINLMVGQAAIIVDGSMEHLKHKVDYYQGTIVVPYKFKEQVIDVLFRNQGNVTNSCLLKIKRIVIDAGHGGYDPGAIGKSGVKEKYINLDIAKRLAKLLKEEGVEVVMTRSSDNFISLERRVEIANHAKAQLFVSIHSNANRTRSLNGLEVYYVSSGGGDPRKALINSENALSGLDKNSYTYLSKNLKGILADMISTYSRAESIELAKTICNTADTDLNTKIIGTKAAGFFVLRGARMPAVLIEVGFVSNREEERLLNSTYYREQIAQAIAHSITNYAKDCVIAQERE